MIPNFDKHGHLPIGGHWCHWEEFYGRFRTNKRRGELCDTLEKVLAIARGCGFVAVLVGGSFVTAKENPRDMDLTWITEPGVTKDSVRPECRKLMDETGSEPEYGWSMLYLAINHNEVDIQDWARKLGFCYKTLRDRGTLLLDL
jgi:hypothetical protein